MDQPTAASLTGPEHYREAEQLLDHAKTNWADGDADTHDAQVAAAQVHATLALASATASAWAHNPDGSTARAWREAVQS